MKIPLATLAMTLVVCSPTFSWANPAFKPVLSALKNGGALVEDTSGKTLFAHRENESFIPASTLKLATALCALKTFGGSYRFQTKFYSDGDGTLYIKGSGDPMLTSEELAIVADNLTKRIKTVRSIRIDDSFFSPDVLVDGASSTTNPYDAPNGAFLVNFNTIAVTVTKAKSITQGEPQTPLTPLAKRLGAGLPPGSHRINIGKDTRLGARYGGELLSAFLRAEGIEAGTEISFATVPANLEPVYVHNSTKELNDIVKGLLTFSTNFTANQLFLVAGAAADGAPATVAKGKRWLTACLSKDVGLKGFNVEEGAGLSRKNSLTPRHLVTILRQFEPYRALLPVEAPFTGKTGTLTGANTYAGYFDTESGPIRFSILVNSMVPHDYKYQVARLVYRAVTGRVAPSPKKT